MAGAALLRAGLATKLTVQGALRASSKTGAGSATGGGRAMSWCLMDLMGERVWTGEGFLALPEAGPAPPRNCLYETFALAARERLSQMASGNSVQVVKLMWLQPARTSEPPNPASWAARLLSRKAAGCPVTAFSYDRPADPER